MTEVREPEEQATMFDVHSCLFSAPEKFGLVEPCELASMNAHVASNLKSFQLAGASQ